MSMNVSIKTCTKYLFRNVAYISKIHNLQLLSDAIWLEFKFKLRPSPFCSHSWVFCSEILVTIYQIILLRDSVKVLSTVRQTPNPLPVISPQVSWCTHKHTVRDHTVCMHYLKSLFSSENPRRSSHCQDIQLRHFMQHTQLCQKFRHFQRTSRIYDVKIFAQSQWRHVYVITYDSCHQHLDESNLRFAKFPDSSQQ